jgi:lysophospholipase L1-like esterase
LRRLGLSLAAIVLTLALAEVALRLTGFGLVRPELDFGVNARQAFERGQFSPDRHLFWKFAGPPGPADEALGTVHPDRDIAPAVQRPRLLFLGDSCTRLGMDGPAYPGRLKAMLARRADVLTAAVPGYTSHQGLVWLRRQLLAARPDIIVVYFGWNDHWRTIGLTDRQYASTLSPLRPRLAALLRRPAAGAPLRVPPADYRGNLEAIAREASAAGCRVLFVRAPGAIGPAARQRLVDTGYLRPDDDPTALHALHLAVLDEVARAHDVPVLDADSIFAGLESPRPLLAEDGIHLTGAGHQVMAVIVAQKVLGEMLRLLDDPRPVEEVAAAAVQALRP